MGRSGATSGHSTTARRARCLRLPADVILDARALVGATRKLSDAELEGIIDALIEVLDARAGDVDREPEDWT